MERLEHKCACIRVWHPMPPVLGTTRHVSSDRFYLTRTNEAVTTWITSSSSWCLCSQTDGDVPATGEGRDWLHASQCPYPQGKEQSGFIASQCPCPHRKEQSGFIASHRHMARKIVALCISVSIPTGEGRDWFIAPQCPQTHGEEDNGFMEGKEESGFMNQSVHSHRARMRVTSGCTKLMR